MRRLMTFPCAGETLAGTLDQADGTTGLLIVSGGNEIRISAHRGMAELAAAVAESGYPVFRFDRRGVGDSTGENQRFEGSETDIVAAAQAFRAHAPQLRRLIGFGNCDAATALALFHRSAELHGLILANPWIGESSDGLPPAAAIRARYVGRLRDPASWRRLVRGQINLSGLIKGLAKLSRGSSEDRSLADRLADALVDTSVPTTVLLARDDNTAIAFADAWRTPVFDRARARIALRTCDTASHSFARAEDKAWLLDQITGLLRD